MMPDANLANQAARPPLEGPTTLRALYPDAPADAAVDLPTEHRGLLQHRRYGRWARRAMQVCVALFFLVSFFPQIATWIVPDVASSSEFTTGEPGLVTAAVVAFSVLLPVLFFGVFFLVIARFIYLAFSGTRLSKWAADRGFVPIDGSWIDDLPLSLATSGHTIRTKRSFKGRVCNIEAVVGGYQWTTGSGKHRKTGFVGLIVLRLPASVAARFRKTVVRDAGDINTGTLVGGMRELRFESSELDEILQVLVPETQDDVACFELFNPPFIELIASRPDARFEQSGEWLAIPFNGTLTPFSDDPVIKPAEIDGDCSLAVRISDRFCQEWQ